MKLIKSIFGILMLALVAVAFTSCNGDNDKNEPTTDPDPVVPVDPTNPIDQKAYMEETAKMFLNKFNPDDQKELLEVVDTFINEYADYDIPDNYDKSVVKNYANNLRNIFGDKNYLASSRSSEIYRFSQYTGHYKVQNFKWVKVADADDIQFSFSSSGTTCTIGVTKSGEEWSINEDGVIIYIPSTIVATVTKGNNTLAKTTIDSNYNESGHTASIKVSVEANNYIVVSDTKITDTKITETQTFTIGGNNIVNSTAAINGNNLGNKSKIIDLIDSDDIVNSIDSYITDVTASVQILNRILIKASGESASAIINAVDYNDSSESDTKRSANILNNHLSAAFYYDNGTTKQGDVTFQAYLSYESYSYKYYDIQPVIRFGSDNTTYDFESYFGNGKFDSIETLFSNLIDKYRNIIDF